MTGPAAPRPVDVHALPVMLTALRLPSFHRHWQALADRADAEGWPASRFLAALAELELAERDARRIQELCREMGDAACEGGVSWRVSKPARTSRRSDTPWTTIPRSPRFTSPDRWRTR